MMVYIPCKDNDEAERIASHLLKKKLIACANIFPVTSMFRWEGKLQNQSETILIGKSLPEKFQKITETVTEMHSYDCPCIEKIDVSWNKPYTDWVRGEVE